MKGIILLFFLHFITQLGMAQLSDVKKAQSSFQKAQTYLQADAYDQAIISLNDAVSADPKFQFAFIQLGDLHRRLKAFGPAKTAYRQAIALNNEGDPRIYYGLAESEINTGEYTDALNNITLFLQKYKGNDKEFIARANKYLRDCQFSVIAVKSPQVYEPVNLGKEVNSSYRDYFPSITADGENLIFSRNIDGNEDFYLAKKNGDTWANPMPLSNKINTKQYNEGAQSISPDGQYLFFTGCNRPDGLGRCDIYVSRKDGDNWGEPFNLGAPVNSVYWDSQPSISPNGSTLYFVSNRPGGIGGYDIWKTILKADGYWSIPQNLGPDINTPYDEHTPFIHTDGSTLYFSSDGWPGLGNKDIFFSRMDDAGKFSKPQNMGYPINTFNEETGLILTSDGTEGLFSANLKDGYGEMDIYKFKMPEGKRPLPVTYVKGIVRDKHTNTFLQANIQVINLKNQNTEYDDYTSKNSGEFLAVMPIGGNYAFNVSADGYLFHSENYELKHAAVNKPFIIEIFLEKLKVGTDVVLKNIFFNTNEYALLPQSHTELNTLLKLLKINTNIHIEIQGHTDNIGNDLSNEKLSLQRAKAVYEYLIANKIPASRLTYKGYGERKPVAGNDTAEERKLNRRTSFNITKL